ncbi:oxidoreductase [Planoprotostelium fungivorum]|uniref:Oxidoreductase n=1 Tax=Planoprotostelium fungivorum TaxID=1890364 RepID=A0A2P6NJU4_9EUKA|nr:oxidoreductase [Planoprotostelium fungivorum]
MTVAQVKAISGTNLFRRLFLTQKKGKHCRSLQHRCLPTNEEGRGRERYHAGTVTTCTMQRQLPILICGGGIAGTTLAYWLRRGGKSSVIVERAPTPRSCGQNIDLRGSGREIISMMGLEDRVRKATTTEDGTAIIDQKGRHWGSFPMQTKEKGGSISAELEILRSDLASILYDATKDDTEFIFGDSVEAIREKEDRIEVQFQSGTHREFSLVVGADGIGSKTRALAFGDEATEAYHPLGLYQAYFSIPNLDTGRWARWLHAPLGRSLLVRPNGKGGTTVLINWRRDHATIERHLRSSGAKEEIARGFEDIEWDIMPQLMDGMMISEDFYGAEVAQIKLNSWSRGRVALVGDAGYCPSSVSAMGTSCAITGAYFLAGELCRHGCYVTAFREYESSLRKYVGDAQKLMPSETALQNPQWMVGILLIRVFATIISYLNLQKYCVPDDRPEDMKLGRYETKNKPKTQRSYGDSTSRLQRAKLHFRLQNEFRN